MPDTSNLPGELPAYARSLGIAVSGEDAGMPLLTVDFGPMVEGRPQHFHGGATAGLLEAAGYAALRTALLCLVVPALIQNEDQRGLHEIVSGSRVARRTPPSASRT